MGAVEVLTTFRSGAVYLILRQLPHLKTHSNRVCLPPVLGSTGGVNELIRVIDFLQKEAYGAVVLYRLNSHEPLPSCKLDNPASNRLITRLFECGVVVD